MGYVSVEEVEASVGSDILNVIADNNRDHVYDPSVLQGALDAASSTADTYLDNELPVPEPTPLALKRAVRAIAFNDLREDRDMGTEGSRLAFSQAMKWLEKIADGKATLRPDKYEPAEGEPGAAPVGDPEVDGLERVWSRASARRVF